MIGFLELKVMPIQPIKIPQNVYIEDRIIGPLTLRQIILVCIGCGFSYALYASLSKAYGSIGIVTTVLVWIPGAISALFAFIKVNDLTLFRICLLLLERINKPGVRTWEPRRGISINIRTFSVPEQEKTQETVAAKKPEKLEELSSALDGTFTKQESEQDDATIVSESVPEGTPILPLPRTPVQPGRIKASPLAEDHASVDGIEPRATVSLFRDITA